MRVALIGDVHANLPALEAVLEHARTRGTTSIWNVGDSVGFGPYPEEVVQQLRSDYALSALGNFDRKVLRFKKRREKWRRTKRLEKYVALEWAYEQLSKKSRRYLRFLSREIRLKVKGRRILLTHTSPGAGWDGLSPDTPEDELRDIMTEAKADVVVCGHSHLPFVRPIDGGWFINPGSVGQPQDGDPRASYGILNVAADDFEVTLYRVEYDVERLVSALCQDGLPEVFAQMFLCGCSLHDILDQEPVV